MTANVCNRQKDPFSRSAERNTDNSAPRQLQTVAGDESEAGTVWKKRNICFLWQCLFLFVCLFSTTSQQIIDAGCVTCNAIVLLVVGKFSYFSWLYVDLWWRLVGWSKENDRIHSSMNFLMFNRNSVYEGKNKLLLIWEQIQLFNMLFCLFVFSLSDLTGDSTHVVLSNCSKTAVKLQLWLLSHSFKLAAEAVQV